MNAPPSLTVSELTAQIKDQVEGSFPSVWVAGEISNFSRPQSGHRYFTLKDDQAQIRAVIWRTTAGRLSFDLSDGQEIICHGHLDVYAPRGSYQLVIDQVELKGVGALEQALRKLRDKLAAEGLFDSARKLPLPPFPRRLAFVTSPTGAAVRDFMEVLHRRWRGASLLILPTRVQGDGAAQEIANAIRTANHLSPPPDVLIVGRGGGSLEDLWAFNEEPVVRAIAASRVPVVSAVGHEIDVTLADLVADVRALTPTEAAELVVPSAEEVVARLGGLRERMRTVVDRQTRFLRSRFESLMERRPFRRPFEGLHDRSRRLDELSLRGHAAARANLRDQQGCLGTLAGKLESLGPLAVLKRGYSLTQDATTGQLIRQASDLQVGQTLTTQFAKGKATSKIESIE